MIRIIIEKPRHPGDSRAFKPRFFLLDENHPGCRRYNDFDGIPTLTSGSFNVHDFLDKFFPKKKLGTYDDSCVAIVNTSELEGYLEETQESHYEFFYELMDKSSYTAECLEQRLSEGLADSKERQSALEIFKKNGCIIEIVTGDKVYFYDEKKAPSMGQALIEYLQCSPFSDITYDILTLEQAQEIVSRNKSAAIEFLHLNAKWWILENLSGMMGVSGKIGSFKKELKRVTERLWRQSQSLMSQIDDRVLELANIISYVENKEQYFYQDLISIDKDIALALVACDGLALEDIPDKFQDDKDVVLMAIAQCEDAIDFASKRLAGDKDIIDAVGVDS